MFVFCGQLILEPYITLLSLKSSGGECMLCLWFDEKSQEIVSRGTTTLGNYQRADYFVPGSCLEFWTSLCLQTRAIPVSEAGIRLGRSVAQTKAQPTTRSVGTCKMCKGG